MALSPAGRLRKLMVNLGLAAASTLIFLAFFEFVVFRIVLPGSDVPRNAYINEVVRYAPHQTGVWRVRDDIAAPFSINAQGWNSPLADYSVDRVAGGSRIAFVGDSFVEALQVPVDASFAEGVARGMGAGRPPEAFRFAVSGAPLSQYVQMVEREVVRFRPDWIVVLLVHNDFDESFMFQPGRYTSSFLKFVVRDGRVIGETPPAPWRPGLVEGLRRSALARFFLYRWQIRPQTVIDAILRSGSRLWRTALFGEHRCASGAFARGGHPSGDGARIFPPGRAGARRRSFTSAGDGRRSSRHRVRANGQPRAAPQRDGGRGRARAGRGVPRSPARLRGGLGAASADLPVPVGQPLERAWARGRRLGHLAAPAGDAGAALSSVPWSTKTPRAPRGVEPLADRPTKMHHATTGIAPIRMASPRLTVRTI